MTTFRAVFVILTLCTAVHPGEPLDEAIALLRDGKVQESVTVLRKVLAGEPSSVRASYLLGQILLDQDNVAESFEVIQKGLAVTPSSVDLLQARGDIEFRRGDLPAAEMSFKKALQSDRNHARSLFGLARVFHAAALRKTAATLFRQARELDPGDAAIIGSFARYAATGAEEQAALEKYLSMVRGADRQRIQSLMARSALHKFLNGRRTWTLATPYGSHSIHMQVLLSGKQVRGVALPVSVSGAKPATLEIDTGASGLTITRRLAERAQVLRIADMDLSGLGDDRDPTGYVGFAESVRIGDVEFHNCVVHVSDKSFTEDSDGLIGTDVFQRFLITLDFRKRDVRLDPLPGPPWDGDQPVDRYLGPELKGFSQVFRFGHMLLIKTVAGESQTGYFLLDTGSDENLISNTAARGVAKVRGDNRFQMKGISGKVRKLESANEVTLAFAGYRQMVRDLLAMDLSNISKDTGTEIAGIVGLPTLILFDMTIDYRDGMVKFVYDPPPGL